MIIYGIPNCDTIRKARKWLIEHHIDYQFHDYRKDGIDKALVDEFVAQLGWEKLLNKRSLTYRQLTAEQKDNLNQDTAIQIMLEQPTIIKRPLLRTNNNELYLGFKAQEYEQITK